MKQFIDDLNHLGGQPCGMFLLVCGIVLSVIYAHWRMPTNIPDQLILAGALLLRQDATLTSTTVVAPNAQTQNVNPQPPHPQQ